MAQMSPLEKWFVNRANPWIYRRVLEPFFRHGLSLPAAPALLELGCGTGQAALITYQLYRPGKFVVTDYDLSQVEQARATFDRAYGRIPDVLAVETADAMQLRYPDASFDAVFAFLVLHHLAEPSRCRAGDMIGSWITATAVFGSAGRTTPTTTA